MEQIVTVRNRARFLPPSASGAVVARDRLDDLYRGATGRVLRMLAPPGYGKSTQMARWLASEPRQVGWIDVERVDNDPVVLAAAVARVLTGLEDGSTDTAWHEAFDGATTADQIAATLGTITDAVGQPYVLVLDDVHNLESLGSVAVLNAFAARLPESSTLVLCGRSHHEGGSVPRLRLRPGIVDVTAEHLALDATETDELLRSMDVHLNLEALTQVCDRFEGWAAGLRLAGLALKGAGERSWMLPDQVGDTTYVVDYLRSEWTGKLSPDDRQLLCEVACLNRFTGAMCDEVLGRAGSLAHLRRIHRDELLVLPLDQRDEWFRMHPLLTRWLSADLAETDRERWADIHRAAAAWWTEHGDIDLAVEHAVVIGDLETAERLVTDHGFTYLARGMGATVRRWLSLFPQAHATRSGGLCVITSLDALQIGDGARAVQWYEHLARLLASNDPLPTEAPLRRLADMLRITLAREPAHHLLPVAESLSGKLSGEVWDALVLYATGGLRFLRGDERAEEALASAAFIAGVNELFVHEANCTSARGIVADLTDDRETAVESGRRAAELVSRWPDEPPSTTAITDALASLNAARAGQRDLAVRHLESARGKLSAFATVAPWFNALCGLAMARAAVLVDDRATSRALLRDLDHALRLEGPHNGATPHLEALRASIEAARQLPSDPAWALTESELNVLQFLPTNLTLADIAAELFVSRNTVKSHVAAIYRKLDATSRSKAVDHARRTGLLDDRSSDIRD